MIVTDVDLPRREIHLGCDLGRYKNVYQRGKLVEVCDPHPTPRERQEAEQLIALLREWFTRDRHESVPLRAA